MKTHKTIAKRLGQIAAALILACTQMPVKAADSYSFRHLDKASTLYGKSINVMLEDHDGYLWIGTSQGLYRYDGYELRNENRRAHLPAEQYIKNLQEDANHYLWISTSGASEYVVIDENRESVNTQSYMRELGMGTDKMYLMHIDTKGNLWRMTQDSIYTYNFETKQLTKYSAPALSSASNERIAVKAYENTLYIVDGNTLYTFSAGYNTWQEEEMGLDLPVVGDNNETVMLTNSYIDKKGGLWVYSMFGESIMRRDANTLAWSQITLPKEGADVHNAIRRIVDDSENGIWIATDHKGLFLYNLQSGDFQHFDHQLSNPNSIASDNVNCIMVDSHHTLWLGYFKNSISYCQPQLDILHERKLGCGDVTALLADNDGSRWVATDGHGLWHELPDGRLVQTGIPNVAVTDIHRDETGNLWVATYDNGLYRIDGKGALKHYDSEHGQLPHDGMQRFAIDGQGRLWVCSVFGAFYCFDPKTETSTRYPAEDGQDLMGGSICYDPMTNRILMGSYYGIWVQDLNSDQGYRMVSARNGRQPLHEYQASNLLADAHESLIWMTHRQGITVWDTQADTLYLISSSDGLNTSLQAIRQDSQHNIWASSVSGLAMIQPVKKFDGSWGFQVRTLMSGDNSNGIFFNSYAGASTPEGLLLFGGPEGYCEFDSRSILATQEEVIQPTFSSIMLGDSLLLESQLLELHYYDHPLTFNFYTGNPLNSVSTRYAYRINGLQSDWVETQFNTITLLSLPPGKYELELKAAGINGEWSQIRTLPLRVSPPWWNASWMRLVYVGLLILLGAFLVWLTKLMQRRKVAMERRKMLHEQQEHLAEMKLQFFTDISHDLRTPLTLIISPLEQMLKEDLPEAMKRRLYNMNKNAQQLLGEISKLLDFRKLDVGAERLMLSSPSDLMTYLREQGDQFYDLGRERNITFRIMGPSEPIVTSFDREKLRKVLYNLLSNAFKHSPNGSEIQVCCSLIPGANVPTEALSALKGRQGVKIEVKDQGAGIKDAEKKRVFQLFYQSGGKDAKPGSGIGLHIARQMVELHGGRLWIEDNKPCGANFCFTLPIDAKADGDDTYDDEMLDTEGQTKSEDKDTSEADDKKGAKISILVVDDNEDLCHFIEESLMNQYDIHCAYCGEDALAILETTDINLIVSDVMMPGISGLELCNKVKTDIRYCHIPFIMLTARAAEQSVLEGLQQGADDYLTKPFNVDRLRLRIGKFIEWSRRCHNDFQQLPIIEPRKITITSLDEQFVQKLLDVTDEAMSDTEFGVEELAAEVGMSRSQLYKKLQALIGKTPLDFLRTMRMKRAKMLLERSQMQISEVAYQVGYNTQKTFSENFKQEFGVTPSDYLKSLKK